MKGGEWEEWNEERGGKAEDPPPPTRLSYLSWNLKNLAWKRKTEEVANKCTIRE